MAKQIYTEDSVTKHFKSFKDVDINSNSKTIYIVNGTSELGNGSYGKIDFLKNHCGYDIIHVNQLTKRSKVISKAKNIDDEDRVYRPNKREKLNMSNMVKNTMRKNKI